MTEPLQHKKKQLSETLEEAQRLHNTGDLVGALKAYRQAQKWVHDEATRDEVQQTIDELHDMVAFVQESEGNHDKKWWEPLLDTLKENALLIAGISITLVALMLLALLIPMVMKSFSKPAKVEPSPSPSALTDRFERGDSYQVQVELKGRNPGGGGGTLKKSTSVVTLTIPEVLYEPYPSKYIIQENPPVYLEPPSSADANPAQTVDLKIPRNTMVLLVGKSDNAQWLKIETSDAAQYWISAQYLADDRYRSPEEIDAEIKTELGGKYWEIQVEGNTAPFQYYLYVNAPTVIEAHNSLVAAYEDYAQRQMIQSMNTISHQKIEAVRLEEISSPPQKGDPRTEVRFRIYAQNSRDVENVLGEKQFIISQGEDKRYILRQLLDGF